MSKKAMTVRLEADQVSKLELIARAEDKSVNEEIEAAVDLLIEDRKRDQEFQEQLDRLLAQEAAHREELMPA